MGTWQNLKDWQKGTIIGFVIVGLIHILLVSLVLFSGGIKGEAWLGYIFLELPLYLLYVGLYVLFQIEIFPHSTGTIFWMWTYLFGTLAWGVVGAVIGFVLGLASNLLNAKPREVEKWEIGKI